MRTPLNFLSDGHRNRGFTLIELMITLAVLAIAMAIAAPSFTRMTENSRLTDAANNVVMSVNLARSEALKLNTQIDVRPIDGNWSNGWQVVRADDDSLLHTFDAPADSISLSSFPDAIQYQASGVRVLPAAPLQFSLCGKEGRGRQLSVSSSGRASVEKLEGGCA